VLPARIMKLLDRARSSQFHFPSTANKRIKANSAC
jgi:hypothetical protein